jgi:hypothetical protein
VCALEKLHTNSRRYGSYVTMECYNFIGVQMRLVTLISML